MKWPIFLFAVLALLISVYAQESSLATADGHHYGNTKPLVDKSETTTTSENAGEIGFLELLSTKWEISAALVTAFLLAYSVGANDVANPFGTAVGSGALTVKQVFVMASIFETAGAVLLGLSVAETIRSKLIHVESFTPECFVIGEICAMFGAAAWQIIATIFGLPVSGTHSIVGATVGFALIEGGVAAVRWAKIIKIVISWVASPVCSGGLACLLYIYVIKGQILDYNKGNEKTNVSSIISQALMWLPIFYALTIAFNTWVISAKGIELYFPVFYANSNKVKQNTYILILAAVLGAAMYFYIKMIKSKSWEKSGDVYRAINNELIESGGQDPEKQPINQIENSTEKRVKKAKKRLEAARSLEHLDGSEDPVLHYLFGKLQGFAACFDAFAHGANDVGNSIGPVIACYAVLSTNDVKGNPSNFSRTQLIIVLYAAVAMCIGLLTLGRRVIQTVGSEITQLTPARGFAIDIMSGITVVVGSYMGVPLSTTHCKVGAVVAVGWTYDKNSLKWSVFKNIIYAWVITVPASAFISGGMYWILKAVLGLESL